MKKILLGTSALLAAAVLSTGAASAAGTAIVGNPAGAGTLTITGSYSFYFGYASNKSAYSAFDNADVKTGGNIKFQYANTLDNGLTVTVSDQLNTSGDHGSTYDSNTATIGSATVGTLAGGQQTGIASAINHNAGTITSAQVGFNDPDTFKWIYDPNGIYYADTVETTYINDNRANEVGYQTPSFSGFTAFGTYTPELNTDGALSVANRGAAGGSNAIINHNASVGQYQVGVTYDNTIAGWTLGGDLVYSDLPRKGTDLGSLSTFRQGQAGASVGYAGFTVVGGWHGSEFQQVGEHVARATVYDIGAGYAQGPYTVGLGWNHFEARAADAASLAFAGSYEGSSSWGPSSGISGTHPKDDIVNLSGAYTIGTGVSVTGEVDYLTAKTDSSTVKDNSGVVVATGLSLSF